MRTYVVLAAVLLVALCGCSDDQSGAGTAATAPGEQELVQGHKQIAEKGIMAEFISAISTDGYERAFAMLSHDLGQAWTQKRFAEDWQQIKEQLSDGWKPEATGSFSGQSPQGLYEQATYRLDSDWNSISSMALVAIWVEGEPKIVDVKIRVAGSGEPSAQIAGATTEFVESMISRDFESVTSMLAPAVRGQYPRQLLAQLSPILGHSVEATSRDYYRMCANGRWYQAVRLTPTADPASSVELVMSTEGGSVQIEGLSAKARVRM